MNSQIQVEVWKLSAYLQQNPTVASEIAIKYKTDYLLLKNDYKSLVKEIDRLIQKMSSPTTNPTLEYEPNKFSAKSSLTIEQEFDIEQFKRTLQFLNNDQSRILAVDYFKRYSALNFKYQNQKNRFFLIQKALEKIDKSK